jgi:hypothetical protein
VDGRLLWRTKLAGQPCCNRWQLQRINPIAFQAPKRARRFTVDREHQHHQAAAALASPGWKGLDLTHAAVWRRAGRNIQSILRERGVISFPQS